MSFPFFSLFFTKQKSERVSDVAKRKMRNKTKRKKCTFVERLTTNSKFIVGIETRYKFHRRAETQHLFFREEEEEKCLHHTPHPKLHYYYHQIILSKSDVNTQSVDGTEDTKKKKKKKKKSNRRHKTSHRETT